MFDQKKVNLSVSKQVGSVCRAELGSITCAELGSVSRGQVGSVSAEFPIKSLIEEISNKIETRAG